MELFVLRMHPVRPLSTLVRSPLFVFSSVLSIIGAQHPSEIGCLIGGEMAVVVIQKLAELIESLKNLIAISIHFAA